jgi:HSP20 family protein
MAKVQKDRTKPRRPNENAADVNLHFGGFLGKLGSMVEKLAELAETGQNMANSGELKGLDPQGKLRGVYGFSIKTAIGEQGRQEVKIEPFGNVHRGPDGGPPADDVREPLVDVYEEEDHVLVLAEIPGVSKKEVQLDLSGDRLTICAQREEKRYRKEVLLPESFTLEKMHWQCANGILKIRLDR